MASEQILDAAFLTFSLGENRGKVKRIQKVVTDSTAPSDPTKTFTYNFVYDGQEILAQYDGNNSLLAFYTHSTLKSDDPLAVNVTTEGVSAGLAKTSGSYVYLKDQLGTITDVADTSGNKIQHYIYSAFGLLLGIQDAQANDVTANPPLNTSYGFAGRELDRESGLMYFRARMYDPASGRFIQEDPSPGNLNIPMSVTNKYSYAANNPLSIKDPTGQSWWTSWGRTTFEIIGIAAAAFLSGGLAGGLIGTALFAEGSFGAIAVGVLVGSAVGGLVGGFGFQLTGVGTFHQGFILGAILGGVAGGLGAAGDLGSAFESSGEPASEALSDSGNSGAFIFGTSNSSAYYTAVGKAVLLGIGSAAVDFWGIACSAGWHGAEEKNTCAFAGSIAQKKYSTSF